jgi:excisionase family DNA binding protein
MHPLLTPTQVAHWLKVSEKTVMRMAADGRLPAPHRIGGPPRFPAEVVLSHILNDDDVKFSGGVALRTADDTMVFEVVEASHVLTLFGVRWAVFKALDDTVHIRPFRSAFVMDFPDHMEIDPVILSCENEEVEEFDLFDLHSDRVEVWSAPDGFFEKVEEAGVYQWRETGTWPGADPRSVAVKPLAEPLAQPLQD